MLRGTQGRLLRALLAVTAGAALVPATAAGETWTVDDDGAECPSATFSRIQDAIDQAAPRDTVVICAGLYEERSVPPSGTNSPSQPGSRNGLTITKPLTLKGAGATKVRIRPAASLGSSLAGTAPYLRDGGGNVVTVARQAGGSSDDNENFVGISGVTIESPDAYAEAALAFFNASGRIADSVVGPLRTPEDASELAGRPHGWGVVMSNSLQGASQATVRRQVTVAGTTVTGYQAGGILFDQSRGTDDSPTTLQRSGIIGYGRVSDSRILGRGATTLYAQTGVRWHAGARGSATGTEISGHRFTADARQSVGLLLTDAELGPDPSDPASPAWIATENLIAGNGYGLYNADIANAAPRTDAEAQAPANWWGTAAGPLVGAPSSFAGATNGRQGVMGAANVTPFRTTAPPIPAVAAVSDAAPTAAFLEPLAGAIAPVGRPLDVTVRAADDFGVKSVTLSVGGGRSWSAVRGPFEWQLVPSSDDAGKTLTLTAEVVDSAGQRSIATTAVTVPAAVQAPAAAAGGGAPLGVPVSTGRPVVAGDRGVGARVACETGSWTGSPTSYAMVWLRAGRPIAGETSSAYVIDEEDVGSRISCRVVASNAAGAGSAAEAAGIVAQRLRLLTATTAIKQLGPSVVRLDRKLVVRAGATRLSLGTVHCVPAAGADGCRVTIAGTLRVGGRTVALSVTRTLRAGVKGTFTLQLTPAARSALALGRSGTLRLKPAVTALGRTLRWNTTVRVTPR